MPDYIFTLPASEFWTNVKNKSFLIQQKVKKKKKTFQQSDQSHYQIDSQTRFQTNKTLGKVSLNFHIDQKYQSHETLTGIHF